MRVRRSERAPTSSGVTCACGCGAAVSGRCALWIYIGNDGADPRIGRVNTLSEGHHFASEACRAAWWEVPTVADLFPAAAGIPEGAAIHASVIHWNGDATHWTHFETGDGVELAHLHGRIAEHHRFDHLAHLHAWWRGDEEHEAEPIPFADAPDQPPAAKSEG